MRLRRIMGRVTGTYFGEDNICHANPSICPSVSGYIDHIHIVSGCIDDVYIARRRYTKQGFKRRVGVDQGERRRLSNRVADALSTLWQM